MDIDEARSFLKTVVIEDFEDKTFYNYIDHTLAGDFAVEIATVIKRLQRVKRAAAAIADNAEECVYDDMMGFAAGLEYLSDLNLALDPDDEE